MDADMHTTAETDVRQFIEAGQSKPALQKAKEHHKAVATDASKSLLLDAFLARIEALEAGGLKHEATALLNLVQQNYPDTPAGKHAPIASLAARLVGPAELIKPLVDPQLSKEDRGAIERLIRAQMADPCWLADCSLLPRQHPLRCQAAALCEAFRAVTSGPVQDEQIALTQVPRNSPLAPWKLLVRAIAMLYRGENAACTRSLGMIDSESAPARLVPPIRKLLGEAVPPERIRGKVKTLVDAVRSTGEPLRQSLAALDDALSKGRGRSVESNGRAALKACQKHRPDLVEKLRQHTVVLAAKHHVSPMRLAKGLGSPAALRDAHYWRLAARSAELAQVPFAACAGWDRFIVHAVHEGWFADDGPELAWLYGHMARLLAEMSSDEFDDAKSYHDREFVGFADAYENQPPQIRVLQPKPREHLGAYYHDPAQLFARAAELAADDDVFNDWLMWVRRHEPNGKPADDAAQAWHAAIPNNVRPLLHLMASAERRGALRKAMGFLEKAQQLDSLSTDVRQARFRLLVSIAAQHLRNRKRRLVEKDLAQIDALDQAKQADGPAVATALAAVMHQCDSQTEAAGEARKRAAERLGSIAAADLLIDAVVAAAKCQKAARKLTQTLGSARHAPAGDQLASIVRTFILAKGVGLEVTIPQAWLASMVKTLNKKSCPLDSAQALQLGHAALSSGADGLAYAAAGCGLRRPDAGRHTAHLLWVRAESLPAHEQEREEDCLEAALHLARQQRDEALVERTLRSLRASAGPWVDADDARQWSEQLEPDHLQAILQREKAAKKYPSAPSRRGWFMPAPTRDMMPQLPLFDDEDEPFMPDTRRGRGELGETSHGFDPFDLPPALLGLLLEVMAKHAKMDGTVPDVEELARTDPDLIERLAETFQDAGLDDDFPDGLPIPILGSGPKRRKRKKRK